MPVSDRQTGDPDDFLTRNDHRNPAPIRSRDTGVGEEVLEGLGAVHAERPDPVTRPPAPHGEHRRQTGAVQRGYIRPGRLERRIKRR